MLNNSGDASRQHIVVLGILFESNYTCRNSFAIFAANSRTNGAGTNANLVRQDYDQTFYPRLITVLLMALAGLLGLGGLCVMHIGKPVHVSATVFMPGLAQKAVASMKELLIQTTLTRVIFLEHFRVVTFVGSFYMLYSTTSHSRKHTASWTLNYIHL